VDQGSPKCTRGDKGLPNDLAALPVVCPHCRAIIELQGSRAVAKLLQCPWCSGLFSMYEVISGSENDSECPGWAQSQHVNRTSSE
jgi:hypothetical protein